MLGELTLSGGDYLGIAALLATFLSVPVTLVVYNLRSLARRVEIVEEEIKDKVSHRDWVHTLVRQENRLGNVTETLARLDGKIDATIGIAGGLQRIGRALEGQVERANEPG